MNQARTAPICLVTIRLALSLLLPAFALFAPSSALLFGQDTNLNREEIKKAVLQKYDTNENGKLDRDEQAALLKENDTDGNGRLDRKEKQALAQSVAKSASKKTDRPSPNQKPDSKPRNNASSPAASAGSVFSTKEILDESTLETKTLQEWHRVGATRQKLIEINVAQWWPGQDYRIPVRLVVPAEGKAKGFHITGAHKAQSLSKDIKPNAIDAKLLEGGVGIVWTVVNPINSIPGKRGLEQKMQKQLMKDLNMRYTTVWIWSMTLMRATTAAYAEVDHFEKGKVAGSGSSKNGISPAVALSNDERFTATCSLNAFAWASPTRKGDPATLQKANAANETFFDAVKAGEIELNAQRAKYIRSHMKGSDPSMNMMAQQAGIPMDEVRANIGRFMTSVCVTENWDQLKDRGVDMLFQPGTHDWVAYDILWGAQNHPQLPTYYAANGGHGMQTHANAEKDEQNLQAFLWNHFFGGEPLLSPPTSTHEVIGDKLKITVHFKEGPQAESGRIWWMVDRAPTGSAPFLHERIPEDQWADMKQDPQTGSWTVTIPLNEVKEKGASRIDFFTNHGKVVNGFQHYLSSPYTRVKLSTK